VLEDDAMVNFRMSKGTVGRLWTSSVAIGRQHGFDIQVFGETGGFRWASEQPNQLIYTPVGGRTQIMEKGEGGLYEDAKRLSRVAIAHPEGFPLAVANIYCDLADAIRGRCVTGCLRPPVAAVDGGGAYGCGLGQGRGAMDGRAPADVPVGGVLTQRAAVDHLQGNSRTSGGVRLFDGGNHQFDGGVDDFGTGWRIVVSPMFCQRDISMSFRPIRPMSPGTVSPASSIALMAPTASRSSPQK
jgi:hypothetical protein